MTDRRALAAAALFLALVAARIFLPQAGGEAAAWLQQAVSRDTLALPEGAAAWLDWP